MDPIRRPEICLICFQTHNLGSCRIFKGFSVRQRLYSVRVHKYCANCLSQGHHVNDCNSTTACCRCGQKHNTLLHKDRRVESNVVPPTQRRSVQDRLQIHNRVTSPQPLQRLQRTARRVADDEVHQRTRDSSRESGALQVLTSRQRRSRRRPNMLQRQLEEQAVGQATTHQLLRQMVATINRLSEAILVAPVQGGRHVEARDDVEEDDDFLDIDMEPLL